MDSITDLQLSRLESLVQSGRHHVEQIDQRTSDMSVYIIGGAVRDSLLDSPSYDLDFLAVEESLSSMRERGFTVEHVTPEGGITDSNGSNWAIPYSEEPAEDYYQGSSRLETGSSLIDDLTRRDFTINALAVQVCGASPKSLPGDATQDIDVNGTSWTLVDRFSGIEDLKSHTLRHISPAFGRDPIRILRGARFLSRYASRRGSNSDSCTDRESVPNFDLAPQTQAIMKRAVPGLNYVRRSRVAGEVKQAMKQAHDPARFWWTLQDVGALAVLTSTLDRTRIVPAGPERYHREGSTFSHTMMVVDRLHEICVSNDISGESRVRRLLMAVAHDLGKVVVAEEAGGLPADDPPRQFPNHGNAGKEPAAKLADQLGLEDSFSQAMQHAATEHMYIPDLLEESPDTVLNYVSDYLTSTEKPSQTHDQIDELVDLTEADHEGRWQSIDVFESPEEYHDDPEAPPDAARPAFPGEELRDLVTTTRTALREIDGHDVLRKELCSRHRESLPTEGELGKIMATCEECRTPGEWVGDALTRLRRRRLEH